jgi:tryptophan-rich sensory protein
MKHPVAVLTGLVVVCLGVGFVGSLWTAPAISGWYAGLAKPSWTPPGAIFGPVWTVLYVSMAVAAWLVWRRVGWARVPMTVFALQLLLNLAWSGIFFGARQPGAAFVEICVLWVAIVATIVTFGRVSRPAGALLVPYLAWVSFASALNFARWRANP